MAVITKNKLFNFMKNHMKPNLNNTLERAKAYLLIIENIERTRQFTKEEENWLNDGSLEVIIKVPSGIIMNFYDKLNSVTHGNAITEDIKEEENDWN